MPGTLEEGKKTKAENEGSQWGERAIEWRQQDVHLREPSFNHQM